MTNTEENSGTFASKPLVSHDGIDDNGVRAEVLVQRGLVNVSQKEEKKNRAQVNFKFTADNLKYPLTGWLNRETDEKLYNILTEAYDNDTPVYVRLEKRRKANIDRSTPIKELTSLETAKDSILNIIAAVRLDENDEWIESSEAVTLPGEDAITGVVKADKKILRKQNSPWTNIEAPPYQTFNYNGDVNPGSDAVAAVSNTYTFVYDYLHGDKCEAILSDDPDQSKRQVMNITTKVLSIANKAQVMIYDGHIDRPEMSKRSHTRARSLIFHSMETVNRITQAEIEDKDALNTWADEVLDRVVSMWKWSIKTVDKIESQN